MINASCVDKKIPEMEFCTCSHKVKVSSRALKVAEKFKQKNGKCEAGGILLGYVYSDYDEITKITAPNKHDKRERMQFIRAKKPAQKEINKSWKKSKGKLVYLGEWHTHSETRPTPSQEDRDMIRNQFNNNEIETEYLYLLIVGLENTFWVGMQDKKGLYSIKRIT